MFRADFGGAGQARRHRGHIESAVSVCGGGLVLRFVGCLDQFVKLIGCLVVNVSIAHLGVKIRGFADRGHTVECLGIVELLNLREEARRLFELNRVTVAVEQALEECLFRADRAGDPGFDALLADQIVNVGFGNFWPSR